MAFRKLFPRALITFLTVGVLSSSAFSQTRARVTTEPDNNEVSCSIDNPAFIASTSIAEAKPVWEAKPAKPPVDVAPSIVSPTESLPKLQPLLLAAIDQRLGSPYHWGSTGPRSYDCSGFVWSIFQAIGVDFERGSARTLFAKFNPPTPEDQYKFGTLVFFNRLSHVGVVVDEKGFYHASRHHGVVYATFDGYWGKHITGFRRVPLPIGRITD
jgi:cell wall-associated NlpC family hydrolase